MDRETRNTLVRLSADESLSLEFRLACRKELGDTVEFAGVASFVKPGATEQDRAHIESMLSAISLRPGATG